MYRVLAPFLFLALSTTLPALPVRAQSTGEIIDHALAALGGKEKLQTINSLYQEGLLVLPNETSVKVRIWRVFDRLYREELDYAAGKVVVVVTPKQGWISSPRTGGVFKALPPDQLKALQTEIDPAGCLIDYSQKGNKVERVGIDTIDGRPCYKLKIWFPNNEYIFYWVDKRNWYIVKETRRGGAIMGGGADDGGWAGKSDGMVDIGIGEYRAIPGGYVLPYAITIGGLGKVNISKVQINGNVDVDALSKPR
jgi:outer membrane lipoprotein-sorting protein